MSESSPRGARYWLMKSEPDMFSFSDLKAKKKTLWDGVRNYTARNHMMKDMRVGDVVLFYHSNANPSAIAGLAKISAPARPDPSAFDPSSEYYDEKSTPEKPRWFGVEVSYLNDLPREVSLAEIKKNPKLKKMTLLQHSRLSVQPVTPAEFETILKMAEKA